MTAVAAAPARIVTAHDAWDWCTSKHEAWLQYVRVAVEDAPVVARTVLVGDREFDPTADAAGNYAFANRMMRLRGILTGEFWPVEDEPFDLLMAAVLMRGTR